jgi:hypothetical protein
VNHPLDRLSKKRGGKSACFHKKSTLDAVLTSNHLKNMETNYNKPSTAGIAMKWGAIAGLVSIILSVILNVSGQANNKTVSIIGGTIILVGGIIYAIKEFKSLTRGYITFGEGLGVGSLVSAVIGLLSGAFTAFYIQFIDDSSIKQGLQQQRIEMEQKGVDDAQIDQAMAIAEKMTGPGFIFIFSFIITLFFGFLFSLIISAIMKHERKELV